MRNISFSLTLGSFSDGTKDVTRRIWKGQWVKPRQSLMGVEKAQGLGKGGKIKKIGEIRAILVEQEPINEIIKRPYRHDGINEPELRFVKGDPQIRSEMQREGFPAFTPDQFVEFFCMANKCKPDQIVYRIVFEHVKEQL